MPRLYEMPYYVNATLDLDKISYVTNPHGTELFYNVCMDNGTEFKISNDMFSPRYLNRDNFITLWSGE